jgi:hypothetical protein
MKTHQKFGGFFSQTSASGDAYSLTATPNDSDYDGSGITLAVFSTSRAL